MENEFWILKIHYVWNCGTGEGSVRVTAIRVDDGQWHQIRILRIGRLSRLTLDDKHRQVT